MEQASDTSGNAARPVTPLSPAAELVTKVCRDVLAALIEADGGRLFFVSATAEDIHLHLAGTCAGCPGSALTTSRILAPTLERVLPKAKLRVTTGWILPAGAVRISPAGSPSSATGA